MCEYITKYPDMICPLFPPEIPCTCTLKAGHYQSDGVTIDLPDLGEAIDKIIAVRGTCRATQDGRVNGRTTDNASMAMHLHYNVKSQSCSQ